MVAPEKIKERQEFGRLFNLELDRIGAPAGRGRIQWVYREIQENRKALVSTQQVRKWVRGIDIPDQANLRIICKRLSLNFAALQPNVEVLNLTLSDPQILRIIEAWPKLEEGPREEIANFAEFKLNGKKSPVTRASTSIVGTRSRRATY